MDPSRVWYGAEGWARAARVALAPASALWREVMSVRRAMYAAGVLSSEAPVIPALSVGNLSVGGTGKTPVSAHIARLLKERGAHPAVLLRGYGADEPQVHAWLNPDIPVVVGADRLRTAREASAQGCDVAVLDDAFQHRRVQRVSDIVLVAAEQWSDHVRTVPAGPYREGAAALRAADLVLVTRKAADRTAAGNVRDALERLTSAPIGLVSLQLDFLRRVTVNTQDEGGTADTEQSKLPLNVIHGAHVLAVTGIGNPRSFERQLIAAGATVTLAAYPDHHAFSQSDVATLVRRAQAADFVVCTLKDAVKLAGMWPHTAPSPWYVSQRIELEEGREALSIQLGRLLDARHAPADPDSPAGPHAATSTTAG